MTRAERTRSLRYKRPALASMGYEAMVAELYEIKEIDAAYEAAAEDGFYPYGRATRDYDRMLAGLPDRMWVE